jgi:hypothetical protein
MTARRAHVIGRAVYFNHLLEGRETHRLAYDTDLARWVWDFLEATAAAAKL